MRRQALYFTAPYKVSVREEELVPPAAGQVLVQAIVSAISAGTELMIYRGQIPAGICKDEPIQSLACDEKFPIRYGYANIGRVVAVGKGVDPRWQGKAVFAFHPPETLYLSSPADLIPIPSDLSLEEAALLPNMETSINFLMDGQPMIGEQVVVFGQGVVGLLTTALLALMPLDKLITLDRYPLRREMSLALGAHAAMDPDAKDSMAQLTQALKTEGGHEGADLTYELSGNPCAIENAIGITGFDGRVVIGSCYGQKPLKLNLDGHFHRSRIRLISSQVSTIAPEWAGRWTKARRLHFALQMLRRLKPAHLITHRFSLAQADKAYALLDQHPHEAVQVLLTYEG